MNCVDSDSREASAQAIEHLLDLGHRRLGICIHVVEDSDPADRVAAYRHALEVHDVAFDERLLIRGPTSETRPAAADRRRVSRQKNFRSN